MQPNPCRCEALREVFGLGAPALCRPCMLRAAQEALVVDGYVEIPREHRLPYQDCGIEIRSFGYLGDSSSYAPQWAKHIADVLHEPGATSPYCGSVMARAATDEEFRHAVDTLIRLGLDGVEELLFSKREAARRAVRMRLEAFAVVQGVTPLPAATR